MDSLAQSIIETIRDPLLVLDDNLSVRVANRSFYHTFQVLPEEVVSRHLYELGDGQWDVPQLRTILEEVLASNMSYDNFEIEHNFPGIGPKTMLLNARQVLGAFEETPLILLAFEDITELRHTEALLQIHVQKLEWSNRELQDFAYIASHDLQEPLRAVQAFGERLNGCSGNELSEEGRDYLERMLRAAQRMRTLIRDLLNFSRITTKAQPFVPVDLNVTAHQVLEDLTPRLEEYEGIVEVGTLPKLQADPTQMRQLLQNLIDNALKYRREGVPPRVLVQSTVIQSNAIFQAGAGRMCRIEVRDNGIGFEQKYADRIFTPFQRLHSRDRYEGTGIGLAICRKIAERHGGRLTVKSSPGNGSTFLIELPVSQH